MKSFKIAFWGSGSSCTRACEIFKTLPGFTIVGIIQTTDLNTGTALLNHFYQTTGLDVLVDTTQDAQFAKHLYIHKPPGVQILEPKGLDMFLSLTNTCSGAYPASDVGIAEDLEFLAQELHHSAAVIKEIQNKLKNKDQKDPLRDELLSLDDMEKILLKKALSKFGSTVEGKKEAAKALNISLATLYNKLKKYRIG